MIIIEKNEKIEKFESYGELFKSLGKEGTYIDKVTDGELFCTNKEGEKQIFMYGELSKDNTKSALIDIIIDEKEIVKKSMDIMSEQGVDFTIEQKNNLNLKFKVLKQVKN
jgi:hypothetical protein